MSLPCITAISLVDLDRQLTGSVPYRGPMHSNRVSYVVFRNKKSTFALSFIKTVSLRNAMDLEKDTQIEEMATQPLPKEETTDAFPKCAASDTKPDDLDPNIIDFDPNDPEDPQTWPSSYKWSITMLLAFMAIIVLRPP